MKSKVLSYKVAVKMQFILNNKAIDIPADGIKSIIINHNYKSNIMPYIIITLNINNRLYNDMVTNWEKAKIFLNTQITDSNSSNIKIDKIKDQFIYFLPNDSNYLKDLDINNNNADQSYKRITIGLMKSELLNFNKKIFNGVQTNVSNSELLSMFTEGRPLIRSELSNNKLWDQILIPPLSSRSDAIGFLAYTGDIFDTDYMYFMDFDKSYLLDMNEKMISKYNNSKYNTIILDIGNLNIISKNYDGIVKDIDNNCYIMYLNVSDTDLYINKTTDKATTELISVSEEGSSTLKLDVNKSKFSTDKAKFIRGEQSSIKLKNSIEKSKTVLNISKLNLDSSLITPDRIYIVKNYKDYTEQNGKYILIYKKEIIVKTDDSFTTNTIMGFCKID